MTQNAVVDAGEDLSMEVNIEGVEPASYQWYFENTPIAGANQKRLQHRQRLSRRTPACIAWTRSTANGNMRREHGHLSARRHRRYRAQGRRRFLAARGRGRWPPWPPRRVCSSSRAAAASPHKQTPFLSDRQICAVAVFHGGTAQMRWPAGEWIFCQMQMQILKRLLEVNRGICMPQRTEKTEPDAPPSCAALPYDFRKSSQPKWRNA